MSARARQKFSLDLGHLVYSQFVPCRCQKHPCTKMILPRLRNTKSGFPGKLRSCSRYRYPIRWTRLLTVISGFVSFDRTRLIRSLRSAVVRVSIRQAYSDHCTTLSAGKAGGNSPYYGRSIKRTHRKGAGSFVTRTVAAPTSTSDRRLRATGTATVAPRPRWRRHDVFSARTRNRLELLLQFPRSSRFAWRFRHSASRTTRASSQPEHTFR